MLLENAQGFLNLSSVGVESSSLILAIIIRVLNMTEQLFNSFIQKISKKHSLATLFYHVLTILKTLGISSLMLYGLMQSFIKNGLLLPAVQYSCPLKT